MSLPRGLLLGRATISDVVRVFSQPDVAESVTDTDGAPYYYLLEYGYGAEGAWKATVQAQLTLTQGDPVPAPSKNITPSVCREVISGFEFRNSGLTGHQWPSTGLCQ